MPPIRALDIRPALARLRKDPALAPVIRRRPEQQIRLNPNRFETLANSILAQQISTAAAASIRRKLVAAAGRLSAQRLNNLSDAEIRGCGVSPQKLGYLRDLVDKTSSGALRFRSFHRWDDEQIITDLVQVRGVGRWTAQMFLIFSLGREDVLPVDDLGVRTAVQRLYQLDALPKAAELEHIARPWRPYASIASWYCWRSLESTTEGESETGG